MNETREHVLKLFQPLLVERGFVIEGERHDPDFFDNRSMVLAGPDLRLLLVRDRGIWDVEVGPTFDKEVWFPLYLIKASIEGIGVFDDFSDDLQATHLKNDVTGKYVFLQEHYEEIRNCLTPESIAEFREEVRRLERIWAARWE